MTHTTPHAQHARHRRGTRNATSRSGGGLVRLSFPQSPPYVGGGGTLAASGEQCFPERSVRCVSCTRKHPYQACSSDRAEPMNLNNTARLFRCVPRTIPGHARSPPPALPHLSPPPPRFVPRLLVLRVVRYLTMLCVFMCSPTFFCELPRVSAAEKGGGNQSARGDTVITTGFGFGSGSLHLCPWTPIQAAAGGGGIDKN
jgi:hypothetical protein